VHPKKIIVDTDVITDYLSHAGRDVPLLRRVMMKSLCYTTVFNAIELFAMAKTSRHVRYVEDVLSAMKILGLNARNAESIGGLMRKHPECSRSDLFLSSICIESKLPLLTLRPKRFTGIRRLRLVDRSIF
jgi:predicted nucleic acid-binding protein